MIKFTNGNMFDITADIRVNTVNCVGVMGAGVALAFKNKYPEMFKEYQKECKKGTIRPGSPHVWKDKDLYDCVTIVNFPTKDHWKEPSEYSYIQDGLKWLRKFLNDYKNKTVTLPALGCGHGGLDWDKVKGMIEQELADLPLEILVYEPSDSQMLGNKLSEEEIKQLKVRGVEIITPSSNLYPSAIKGKSSQNLYVQGSLQNLTGPTTAIVISRQIEEREQKALDACLPLIRQSQITPVLGTSPSERIIIKEFLESNRKVIVCIDMGILNFKIPKGLEACWDSDSLTIVSPFLPSNSGGRFNSTEVLKTKIYLAKSVFISTSNLQWMTKVSKSFLLAMKNPFYINFGENIESVEKLLHEIQARAISRSSDGKPKLDAMIMAALGNEIMLSERTSLVAEKSDDYTLN